MIWCLNWYFHFYIELWPVLWCCFILRIFGTVLETMAQVHQDKFLILLELDLGLTSLLPCAWPHHAGIHALKMTPSYMYSFTFIFSCNTSQSSSPGLPFPACHTVFCPLQCKLITSSYSARLSEGCQTHLWKNCSCSTMLDDDTVWQSESGGWLSFFTQTSFQWDILW